MKKSFALLGVLLMLLTIVLIGCSSAREEEGKEKPVQFKLAHATWVGYAPLYIAKEKGLFEKYGLAPELVVIEDESQYAGAMASGQIQALGNVVDREVIHSAKGTAETFILAMDESAGGDGIIAKKEITKVADLKGTTIGLDKSSTAYFFLLSILEKNGLKEADVTIQEMSAGDAGAAFVAGKLDAAVVWEPWLTNSSQREGGHVLVNSKEYPHTIVDVITLRQDFLKEHPEAATGLTKAWFEAIDFYRQNPDEGNAIMAKALGLQKEEIADMAKGVAFFGKEENKAFFAKEGENTIYTLVERAGKFWQEKGIISEQVNLDQLIDTTYVNEAAK
ncbi:ABC transporter substrate-binding protein [Desulforamulus aeronauticus]|uniref:NitT/TauT family transport system substrate-binding protein n=1 Tax=Desulforamulus aeronauticus DSM 10349 TaxID=1121421 RepID=A0A1M6QHN0_9FIRM|nr:ABC transporter substrate-binding protein [Desulforamulus aeronauticus]SHK19563.1 NitT/TauT family transport system substrate-binding protein [Desulforamulus aeronauticus DSM 10349]